MAGNIWEEVNWVNWPYVPGMAQALSESPWVPRDMFNL